MLKFGAYAQSYISNIQAYTARVLHISFLLSSARMVVLDMARWKCPAVLMLLVILVLSNTKITCQPALNFVELFAGRGEVSQALRRINGWSGSSHDLETSGFMDMCSTSGFLHLG